MKRIVALFVALGLVCGMTLGFAPTTEAKTIIKIAGMKPEGEPETIGMHPARQVPGRTFSGTNEVQVFNSQLGKKRAHRHPQGHHPDVRHFGT